MQSAGGNEVVIQNQTCSLLVFDDVGLRHHNDPRGRLTVQDEHLGILLTQLNTGNDPPEAANLTSR